jgi:hypothetical protein
VTFDDKAGQDQALNGQYPTGVIDWGTNTWYHSGPWGPFTTKSVSFHGGGATSRTFTFLTTPRRLVSVRVFNGGGGSTTITLSCSGQTTKTQSVAAGQVATVTTGWTGTCTTVTVGSSNGWDTNFDDLVHDSGGPPPADTTPPTVTGRVPANNATGVSATANVTATFNEDVTGVSGTTFELRDASNAVVPATVTYSSATTTATLDPSASLTAGAVYTATLTGGAGAIKDLAGNPLVTDSWSFTVAAASSTQTVTFDDKAGQNQALNGQYPTGVIDWGTNTWYHSGPWGPFTTKSVSFNGGGVTSRTFTFLTTPRRLVSVRVFNGGGGSTTVTLSCSGQTTKTQSVAAGQVVTIDTGWTGTCTTVTVGSSNGWDTNFDDLVYAPS